MSRRIALSLDGLPHFVGTPLFCCIDTEVEDRLRVLPDTFTRMQVACRFLQNFGASAEHLRITEAEVLPMWAGYLRAALMEYAGMEEASRADGRRLGIPNLPVTIDSTQSAMLILLREMRHLHVHLVQSRFDQTEREVVLRFAADSPQEALNRSLGLEQQSRISVVTVPRADLDQLLERRTSSHFHRSELESAINWLDGAQNRWGIRDVVLAAVEDYSRRLVAVLPTSAA